VLDSRRPAHGGAAAEVESRIVRQDPPGVPAPLRPQHLAAAEGKRFDVIRDHHTRVSCRDGRRYYGARPGSIAQVPETRTDWNCSFCPVNAKSAFAARARTSSEHRSLRNHRIAVQHDNSVPDRVPFVVSVRALAVVHADTAVPADADALVDDDPA